jgi:hypothetical protein
VPYAAF